MTDSDDTSAAAAETPNQRLPVSVQSGRRASSLILIMR